MKTVSQKKQILNWLETGKKLTDLDALSLFGCRRLASRIHELKSDGHPIVSEMIEIESGKRIARYRMKLN